MREIEFRGKDIRTGLYVYGTYYKHLKRTPCPIGDEVTEDDYVHLIINGGFSDWNMPRGLQAIEVDPDTVGQYTGLKAKYGHKIYEGDRIKGIYVYDEQMDWFYSVEGVVKFRYGTFYIEREVNLDVVERIALKDLRKLQLVD